MTLEELAKKLALLKQLKEYHETCSKTISSEIADISSQLFDAFMNAQTDSIRISGELFKDKKARIIKPELEYKPTVILEPKLFSWLRANSYGELIKEQIHHKTLESLITSLKENNKALPPEEAVKIFTLNTATVRRAPKS